MRAKWAEESAVHTPRAVDRQRMEGGGHGVRAGVRGSEHAGLLSKGIETESW